MTKSRINILAFEDIIEGICYNNNLPSTDQIEEMIYLKKAKMVSINNVIICAEELIGKLARIELVLLKQGEEEAAKRWYELGLPEPKY
jgi:hypothetical protein